MGGNGGATGVHTVYNETWGDTGRVGKTNFYFEYGVNQTSQQHGDTHRHPTPTHLPTYRPSPGPMSTTGHKPADDRQTIVRSDCQIKISKNVIKPMVFHISYKKKTQSGHKSSDDRQTIARCHLANLFSGGVRGWGRGSSVRRDASRVNPHQLLRPTPLIWGQLFVTVFTSTRAATLCMVGRDAITCFVSAVVPVSFEVVRLSDWRQCRCW